MAENSTRRSSRTDRLVEERAREFFGFLRCPACGGRLIPPNDGSHFFKSADLRCEGCRETFAIKNYIPRMLPPRLAETWRKVTTGSGESTREGEAASAREWFLASLGIDPSRVVETPGSRKLWKDIAYLRRSVRSSRLNEDDLYEFIAMWGARGMAPRYKRIVADQLFGERHATDYERYEDVLLRVAINVLLQDAQLVLIEMGSGVGRYLVQYASCASSDKNAARQYRNAFRAMYAPESLPNAANLRMLVGIDFEERMLRSANTWMNQTNLSAAIRSGFVSQIQGSIQDVPLAVEHSLFGQVTKLVCVMFQTIGNQLTEAHRVHVIRKAWQLARPSGVLILSAFNGETFDSQGVPYYESIQPSVGKPIFMDAATFVSEKGIYSKWMMPLELEKTCHKAGIRSPLILTTKNLAVFPHYDRYIPTDNQAGLKNRALLAIAATSKSQMAALKEALSQRHAR